eukprot:128481-Alexandrium_andersonii.AAC.1
MPITVCISISRHLVGNLSALTRLRKSLVAVARAPPQPPPPVPGPQWLRAKSAMEVFREDRIRRDKQAGKKFNP